MEEATAVQSFPEPDPAAFQSTSNFVFHQISWQYFLWLTSEVSPGKARFETLFSDAAIDPDHANDTTHVLGGVQQANSEGILVDTNGRAIYTTMMINDVYQDFVIKNKLYDPAALQAFPADTSFPVGALSLKAAWKIVQPGEDVSGFYTTKEAAANSDFDGAKAHCAGLKSKHYARLKGWKLASAKEVGKFAGKVDKYLYWTRDKSDEEGKAVAFVMVTKKTTNRPPDDKRARPFCVAKN